MGYHGKNAELRISTAETILSGVVMPSASTAQFSNVFRISSGSQQNWKYDPERTLIQFSSDVGQPIDTQINTQTRLINYAAGAIWLGQYATASGVYAMAVSLQLSTVGNLIGDARSFTARVAADTVDGTTIGETWKTFVDGLQGFEGSLEGLYINDFWYKQAISTISGVIPQKVLRLRPRPDRNNTYYQGTVVFPQWEVTGGFDAVIERSVEFQGRGPLDLIEESQPFFSIHATGGFNATGDH